MTIDIEQLRTLLAKATPGLWSLGKPYTDDEGYREFPLFASVNGTTVCPVVVCLPFPHVSGMQEANAAFIMAARAALPALLDEVERLRATQDARPCSCPGAGDGSLRHPCAVHPAGRQQHAGDVDDREAWAADMVAAGAQHLGDECWEWESDDFLFHLWQVAARRQHAALSATQPEQGERD